MATTAALVRRTSGGVDSQAAELLGDMLAERMAQEEKYRAAELRAVWDKLQVSAGPEDPALAPLKESVEQAAKTLRPIQATYDAKLRELRAARQALHEAKGAREIVQEGLRRRYRQLAPP